jgi:hypothetical protein
MTTTMRTTTTTTSAAAAAAERTRPTSSGFNRLQERFDKLQKIVPSEELIPALELILSEDADDISLLSGPHEHSAHPGVHFISTFASETLLTTKPRREIRTNVQWCHSESCPVCRPRSLSKVPLFLPAPSVKPKDIRRLPRKWWMEKSYDEDWFETMLSTLYYIFGAGSVAACGGQESSDAVQGNDRCGVDLCHDGGGEEEEDVPFDVLRKRQAKK